MLLECLSIGKNVTLSEAKSLKRDSSPVGLRMTNRVAKQSHVVTLDAVMFSGI